jgi:hypothetical protein
MTADHRGMSNLPARLVLFVILAAALALPAAAFAREGESGGGRHTTTLERPESTEAEKPESAEKPEGTEKSERAEAPEAEVEAEPVNDDAKADDDGNGDSADDDEQLPLPELPELHPAFLRRSWKFAMGAYGFNAETKVLSASVERISGLPRKLRRMRTELRDLEAAVTVGPRTRVQDEDGHRVKRADIAAALDGAEDVIVTGKITDPKKWTRDEEGEPIVAVAAKRIRIR